MSNSAGSTVPLVPGQLPISSGEPTDAPSPEPGHRFEEDLLGTKAVPAEVYYGIHTVRALENFQISGQQVIDIPELILGMVAVKKASALANKDLGAVPAHIADAIIAACNDVLDRGSCLDQFPIDVYQGGAGTSVNMNANEVLANLALEHLGLARGRYDVVHPNDHVNCSQSTNDAYPTALRIACCRLVQRLSTAIGQLVDELAYRGEEFAGVLKLGRTQLQDAVPMTLGDEFGAFAALLREEIEHLRRSQDLLLEVNLGATAIGTGLNAPPGYAEHVVAQLRTVTGLPVVRAENLIEATSDTGAYVSIHSAAKRTAVKLAKVCNDLRLLSSGPHAGFNELNLPQVQAGSSIMPAKVNPVIPEVVNQVCFTVFGNDVAVTMAAEAGQLQLNAMEPLIAHTINESVTLLTTACDALREKCVAGITANDEVCLQNARGSVGIIAVLNPVIGHHNGDLVGKECVRTGRSVREVVRDLGLLDETEIDTFLSVENLRNPQYLGRSHDGADTDAPTVQQPGTNPEPGRSTSREKR